MSSSRLYDSASIGLTTTRDKRPASSMPSSRSNSHARVCCASKLPLQPVGEFGDHALQMLQLLIQLLAQPRQFVGVAQFLGVDFFVERAGIGAIGRPRASGSAAFAPRLRAAGPVVALGDRGFLLGIRAVVVGGFAFHFLRVGAEHGFRFGFGLTFAVLGVVLLAGLFAAVLTVLGVVVGFGLDLGLRQIQRRQQFSRGAGERVLVVLRVGHFGQRGVGVIAQRVAPHDQDRAAPLPAPPRRTGVRAPAAPAPCRSATGPCASCGRSLPARIPRPAWRADCRARPVMCCAPTTSTRTCSSAS